MRSIARINSLLQVLEHLAENYIIFGARWLLIPAYLVLVVTLGVLSFKSIDELYQLLSNLHKFDEAGAISQSLVIVDLVLVMNLILMILFVGYMNFVSIIHPERDEDWPRWMGTLDYSGLKVQVMASIVAIAAVKLLRAFMDISSGGPIEHDRLLWLTIILGTFVVSVLLLAYANTLKLAITHSQFDRISEEVRRPTIDT